MEAPPGKLEQSVYSVDIYANQEKKHVAGPPLNRKLFQLLAGSRSQAKKRKRLLAVWVKISRLVMLHPVKDRF